MVQIVDDDQIFPKLEWSLQNSHQANVFGPHIYNNFIVNSKKNLSVLPFITLLDSFITSYNVSSFLSNIYVLDAFINFSNTSPVLNIASITDTAAGQCTVAFTTSFDDAADYCITTGTLNTDGAQEVYEVYVKATGSFRTYVFNSGGGAGVDPEAFYSV